MGQWPASALCSQRQADLQGVCRGHPHSQTKPPSLGLRSSVANGCQRSCRPCPFPPPRMYRAGSTTMESRAHLFSFHSTPEGLWPGSRLDQEPTNQDAIPRAAPAKLCLASWEPTCRRCIHLCAPHSGAFTRFVRVARPMRGDLCSGGVLAHRLRCCCELLRQL